MKKFILSSFVILSFIIYSIHERTGGSKEAAVVLMKNELIPPTLFPGNQVISRQTSGQYKDGQYTGDLADAYYGNVQVKAIIQNGKIADVQFLDYPSDRRTSVRINTEAMPYLKTEAIQAQNAQVDVVSGATQTSRAFIESLQSALQKAKN